MFVDSRNKIAVYIIKNINDGKCYVGITNNLKRRFKEHKTKGQNSYLCKALTKHGVDSFEFTHVADAFSWEMACDIECMLIKDLNSKAPYGYNMTDGGEGAGLKGELNPMFGMTGDKNPFFGKKHTAETILKMKEAKQNMVSTRVYHSGEQSTFFGRKHSPETILKMQETHKRRAYKHSPETIQRMKDAHRSRLGKE
jgi:group I intron endonuclease